MDPFEEAAMAEMAAQQGGAPMMPEQALAEMETYEPTGQVQCQVCSSIIDAASGAPLEEDPAAAMFAGPAMEAEMGGVPLV